MKVVAGVGEENVLKDECDVMVLAVAMIKMIGPLMKSKMP